MKYCEILGFCHFSDIYLTLPQQELIVLKVIGVESIASKYMARHKLFRYEENNCLDKGRREFWCSGQHLQCIKPQLIPV